MWYDLAVTLAIIRAGAVSALGPCVLPLLPTLVCLAAGIALLRDRSQPRRRVPLVVLASAVLALGFSAAFVVLLSPASAAGHWVAGHRAALTLAAGALIAATGAALLALSLRGARPLAGLGAGLMLAVAAPLGAALMLGWTACIGPVLAPILALTSSAPTLAAGRPLLIAYAAGLATALVGVALAAASLATLAARRRPAPIIARVLLALGVVATGIALPYGGQRAAGTWLLERFPALGELEERVNDKGLPLEIMKRGAQQ